MIPFIGPLVAAAATTLKTVATKAVPYLITGGIELIKHFTSGDSQERQAVADVNLGANPSVDVLSLAKGQIGSYASSAIDKAQSLASGLESSIKNDIIRQFGEIFNALDPSIGAELESTFMRSARRAKEHFTQHISSKVSLSNPELFELLTQRNTAAREEQINRLLNAVRNDGLREYHSELESALSEAFASVRRNLTSKLDAAQNQTRASERFLAQYKSAANKAEKEDSQIALGLVIAKNSAALKAISG